MSENKLSRYAMTKIIKGEELRAAAVRVKIEKIRRNPFGSEFEADVVFEAVDDQLNVLSEMGRATVMEGNSVTIVDMDRAFTFTICS